MHVSSLFLNIKGGANLILNMRKVILKKEDIKLIEVNLKIGQ